MCSDAWAEHAGDDSLPLPRSLSRAAPAVRLRRADPALSKQPEHLSTESGDKPQQNMCAKKKNPEKAAALPFFHRLRLPLASFTFIEAASLRLAKPDVASRCPPFPVSSSLLRPPHSCHIAYRIPYRLFPLRDTWRFLIAHVAGISGRLRQFAPGLAVGRTPPFSPTAAPVPVTVLSKPTRKDTINRHWQQPLVEDVQEITDTEFLKLKSDCDYTERTNLVAAVLYTLLPFPIRRGRRLLAGRINPPQGGFFR